jgi:hypothetical protein
VFRVCFRERAKTGKGRLLAVTTGCFQAAHLQGLVCGGEPGRASVTSRPSADFQACREQSLRARGRKRSLDGEAVPTVRLRTQ